MFKMFGAELRKGKRSIYGAALSVALSLATITGGMSCLVQPITAYAAEVNCGVYDAAKVYVKGDRVEYCGATYEAKWWTQGETPDATKEWGVWKLVSGTPGADDNQNDIPSPTVTPTPVVTPVVTVAPTPVVTPAITDIPSDEGDNSGTQVEGDTYDVNKVYIGGDRVIYHGATYEARWWTKGDIPDPNNEWGVWKYISGNTIDPDDNDDQNIPDDETTVDDNDDDDINVDPKPILSDGSRLLIGYWHTWGGGASGGVPFVKLRDVDDNWDVINISFAEPVNPGSTDGRMKFEVSGLSSSYTKADFKKDIKDLQARGKKIVLSIGGYEGYFSLTSKAAVNQFVSDIKGFVDEYGFDGIDIDLEQSSVTLDSGADPDFKHPKSIKVVNMIDAIRQICNSYGDDFILSWAPETFYVQMGHQYYAGLNGYVDARSGVYLPMINALRNETSYVHVQLYNSIQILGSDGKYYSMGSADSTVAMCSMLLDGFYVNNNTNYFFEPLRPDQVVIGVPSSQGAAGSGHITNDALQSAFRTLEAKYPGMRGIMTWSINWDAFQNKNSFAKSNGAFLDTYMK